MFFIRVRHSSFFFHVLRKISGESLAIQFLAIFQLESKRELIDFEIIKNRCLTLSFNLVLTKGKLGTLMLNTPM